MLFSSSIFLLWFLPIAVVGNYCLRGARSLQNVFLLLASLFFYAWGEPWFVLVMIGSILINYGFGYGVRYYRDDAWKVKSLMVGTAIFNLGLIFCFKYVNFLISEANDWLGTHLAQTHIVLPIGISFFTFQALSYVIDVHRGRGDAQTNPINVALYITFFPQLIAGPIVRYETVAEQISCRVETVGNVMQGIGRFVVGLAKKVLLANTLAVVADRAFDSTPSDLSVAMAWLGILAFSLQIYFDFSGYSDMAIGLGKMFGFHFLENFNYPYISKSVSEFWRRWHISLGTWFRDYLYIPMGGSRVPTPRLLGNLFVVWILTGMWHGANWTYVVWGIYYFFFIACEKVLRFEGSGKQLPWLKHGYTLAVVLVGWVLFRSSSLGHAVGYFSALFGACRRPIVDEMACFYWRENAWYFILAACLSMPIGTWLARSVTRIGACNGIAVVRSWNGLVLARVIAHVVLFLLSLSFVIKSSYNPFIYFAF